MARWRLEHTQRHARTAVAVWHQHLQSRHELAQRDKHRELQQRGVCKCRKLLQCRGESRPQPRLRGTDEGIQRRGAAQQEAADGRNGEGAVHRHRRLQGQHARSPGTRGAGTHGKRHPNEEHSTAATQEVGQPAVDSRIFRERAAPACGQRRGVPSRRIDGGQHNDKRSARDCQPR